MGIPIPITTVSTSKGGPGWTRIWPERQRCRTNMGRDQNTTLRWRHNERDCVPNHQPRHCLLNRLFGRRSKKTSKLRVTGLCAGNSPRNGEFPAQMASNAENVSIWWRHHEKAQHTNPHTLVLLYYSVSLADLSTQCIKCMQNDYRYALTLNISIILHFGVNASKTDRMVST